MLYSRMNGLLFSLLSFFLPLSLAGCDLDRDKNIDLRCATCSVPHAKVNANFPTGGWTFSIQGHPPAPARTDSIVYDGTKWHHMGRIWGDGVELLLYTTNDGLSGWTAASNNPIIKYDATKAKKDEDWYVQRPCYATYPDGTLKKVDGRLAVVVVNFDGMDSDLQWLTSKDGFLWDQRGDTGVDIGPYGSEDRGEQWPASFIYNPVDSKWYLFYHGGGKHDVGRGRTIGFASGSSFKNLKEWRGHFEHNKLITQEPHIIRDPESWIMIFIHGFKEKDGLWYARSDDLKKWNVVGKLFDGDVRIYAWTTIESADTITWRLYGAQNGVDGLWQATSQKIFGGCELCRQK